MNELDEAVDAEVSERLDTVFANTIDPDSPSSISISQNPRRVCLLGLEKAGIDFVAADMPNANRLTVGIMAMVAEEERRMISKRTKDALAAAKRRGKKLGGDRGVVPTKKVGALATAALQARADSRVADIAPIIKDLQAAGAKSLRDIAKGLKDAGIPTARGQGQP